MLAHRARVICTILLCCLLFLVACQEMPKLQTPGSPGPTKLPRPTPTPTSVPPTPAATVTAPAHFTQHILLNGVGRPDDLAFDQDGNVLFSDFYNGTISRLNANGKVTVLLRSLAGPEGLVVLPNGRMIIAEQRTNRILSFSPGDPSPTVLRMLPGVPSSAPCKDGVDGIAFDPTNNTIIVPDSPIGVVYSLSLDGQDLTQIASGITRPVGATVDTQGNIYIADECGGKLYKLDTTGKLTSTGGFGMLDDVVLDQHGNVLVTDLRRNIHALIRMNFTTGKREVLAQQGLIEPQGLLIDARDNIYLSDDYANVLIELKPV